MAQICWDLSALRGRNAAQEEASYYSERQTQSPTQARLGGWKSQPSVPTEAEGEKVCFPLLPQWLLYGTAPG